MMKIYDFEGFPNPARVRVALADITVFAGLGFADFAKVDIPEDCASLAAWRTRVGSRLDDCYWEEI